MIAATSPAISNTVGTDNTVWSYYLDIQIEAFNLYVAIY